MNAAIKRAACLIVIWGFSTAVVAAEDVRQTIDNPSFSTENENMWLPGVDPEILTAPIVSDFPILLEETGPVSLEASESFIATFGTATRVGNLETDIFCSEDEFGFEGACYTCPGNFDVAASTTVSLFQGEAVCVDDTDVSEPVELGLATIAPQCPANTQFDFLSGVCHESCPAGSAFNSITQSCIETIVIPVEATCSSGTLVGNECLSCGSDRELVFDPFNGGASCKKAPSLSKMVVVGENKTTRVCEEVCTPQPEICEFGICVKPPAICEDVCIDVPYVDGEVTAFISGGKYYGCPDTHPTHDPLVSFNQTGICRKNYSNIAANATTPDCPGDIQPVLGLCAGDIETTVATYETQGAGCQEGSFLDDQKPGYCFYCREDEIWTPSDPIFNPGAPDSCTAVALGTLSDNEPTLGCD
ncbi:MAG: hypothetical protein ACE37D_20000, partial [Pseudomonadales bacterium]